jgi:hypothetical protein
MRNKLSFIFIVIVMVTAWAGFFAVASAHVTQTDGSISVTMHIEPDDDPIANQPAKFFFEFQDTKSKFNTADCNCNVIIFQNDKKLASLPLFKNTDTSDFVTPQFLYTFPGKAVYDIKLSGSSKVSGGFQSFALDFAVRVDKEELSNQQSVISSAVNNHAFHFIVFGLAFLVILVLYVKEKRKSQSGKNNSKPKGTILPLLAAIALSGFLMHGSMLDTALCLHDHPVMQGHQCCAVTPATAVPVLSFSISFNSYYAFEFKQQAINEVRFNFSSSRSPPKII